MALAVAQTKSTTASGNVSVTSPSFTSTSGSLLVVVLCAYNPASVAVADGDITDSKSNSYTRIPNASIFPGTNVSGIAAYFNNAGTRGTSHTVTGNPVNSGGGSYQICVIEFSGFDTSTPIATATAATANDTTSAFDVTAAAAVPSGGAGIYGCSVAGDSGSSAWGDPSGYTVAGHADDASADLVYYVGYKLNETGTPTVGGTWGGTVGATSPRECFFAVQAAGGGGGQPPYGTATRRRSGLWIPLAARRSA